MAGNSEEQPRRRGPGRPFMKGQSGNPGGRPKEVGHVRELARQHTEEAIETLVSIMRDDGQPGRSRAAAAEALLNRVMSVKVVYEAVCISGRLGSGGELGMVLVVGGRGLGEAFHGHVAAGDQPIVVLLGKDRADQADHGGTVGERSGEDP